MERHVLDPSSVSAIHRLKRTRRQRGFTLVELAIVVTIVGVLAVIAVVGYRKYILNSKIGEARQMVSAIRLAQEAHRAEVGTYASIGTTFCPAGAGKGNTKVGWNPACSGGTATWNRLPVHADGAVQFSYATIADNDPKAKPPTSVFDSWNFVNFSAGKDGMYYIVGARCDLADDGAPDTQVLGSSYDNQIRTANDGS